MKSALTSLTGCCRLAGPSAQPKETEAVNDLRFDTVWFKWLIDTFLYLNSISEVSSILQCFTVSYSCQLNLDYSTFWHIPAKAPKLPPTFSTIWKHVAVPGRPDFTVCMLSSWLCRVGGAFSQLSWALSSTLIVIFWLLACLSLSRHPRRGAADCRLSRSPSGADRHTLM